MSDVVFRRVHGRIVPIRVKKESPTRVSEALKGAALVAGGVATAVVAGKLGAFAVRNAAHLENSARGFAKLARAAIAGGASSGGKQMTFDFTKNAGRAFQASTLSLRNFRNAQVLQGAGIAIGGALAGEGIKRGIESATGSKIKGKEEVLARATGAGVALASGTAYFKSLGSLSLGGALKEAVSRTIRRAK